MAVIVVVAIIIIGVIWYTQSMPDSQQVSNQQVYTEQIPTLSSGNSNEDLDKDLATIDAELKTTASNSQSVDQSLNDKPISQAE